MSEPTIDECIAWLEVVTSVPHTETERRVLEILEQYKLQTTNEPESRLTIWGYTIAELGEIVRQHETWVAEQKEIQRKKGKTT